MVYLICNYVIMEFRLQKTIEATPFYLLANKRRYNMPSYPNTDHVNPGIGFATKIHDFYVPLYANTFPYPINKKDNLVEEELPIENALNQLGTGNDDEIITNDTIEMPKVDATNNNDNINEDINEGLPVANNKKRLNDGINFAFKHPKIKVAKISFDKPSKFTSKKTVNHKFNIV